MLFIVFCVQVVGEGVYNTQGTVLSVSEQTDQVTVELDKNEDDVHPRYSSVIKVPLARVVPVRNEVSVSSFHSENNNYFDLFNVRCFVL